MPPTLVLLSPLSAVLWVLVGIIISLVLPLAVKTLQTQKAGLESLRAAKPTFGQRLAAAWVQYGGNKYLAVLVAAVVVAVVIVFLLGLQFYTVRDAAIAGFAWESFVKKLFAQQNPPPKPNPQQ